MQQRICVNFRSGTCRFGDKCRDSHALGTELPKKIICAQFQSGSCRFGDKCRDSHALGTELPKKIICAQFQSGSCRFGDQCRNSHALGTELPKKIICAQFQSGSCRFGAKCRNLHEKSEKSEDCPATNSFVKAAGTLDGSESEDCRATNSLVKAAGTLDGATFYDFVADIEKDVLNIREIHTARLPADCVSSILSKQQAIKMQYDVELSRYADSPNGLTMIGHIDGLRQSRKMLCQFDNLSNLYCVGNYIQKRFKLILQVETEIIAANEILQTRRVLITQTGELAIIRGVCVEVSQETQKRVIFLNIELKESTDIESGDITKIPADAVILWDFFDRCDSMRVAVLCRKGAYQLNNVLGNLRRAFSVAGVVEKVEYVSTENRINVEERGARAGRSRAGAGAGAGARAAVETDVDVGAAVEVGSEAESGTTTQASELESEIVTALVTFDITADLDSPAKAMTILHNTRVAGIDGEIKCVVVAPTPNIRVNLPVIDTIRVRADVSDEVLEEAFPGYDYNVKRTTNEAGNTSIVVKFKSGAAALSARRALNHPQLLDIAKLDVSQVHIVYLENVPSCLGHEALLEHFFLHENGTRLARSDVDVVHHCNQALFGFSTICIKFKSSKKKGVVKFALDHPQLKLVPELQNQFQFRQRVNLYFTITSIIRLITGVATKSILGDNSDTDEDKRSEVSSLGDGTSTTSAMTSMPVATDKATSLAALQNLAQECDTRASSSSDGSVESKSSGKLQDADRIQKSLNRIIFSTWPRLQPHGTCFDHINFELGLLSHPCRKGYLCRHKHILKSCKGGAACPEQAAVQTRRDWQARCHYIHPADIVTLCRQDIALNKVVQERNVTTFAELQPALLEHRRRMNIEADRLLAIHKDRLEKAQGDLSLTTMTTPSTIESAQDKRKTVEVLQSRCTEIEHQINEFRKSREEFEYSDPTSFRDARLFSRVVYNRFKSCLPIYAEKQCILNAVKEDYSVLVLSAETGSGKSTQVVQYISECVSGMVLCTQPRRVAAVQLAERVAEEMMTAKESPTDINIVTYKGPQSKANHAKARIQFMTDASLLNTLYHNPNLSRINAVVVDEVHERSVNTDLLIALLRRTLSLRAAEGRYPFKIILTSATMNEGLFARYFARNLWDPNSPMDTTWAPVLKVGGRTFPVEIHYEEGGSVSGYERAAEAKAIELHGRLPSTNVVLRQNHDILIFLTQADECDRVAKNLKALLPDTYVVALHGSLDKDDQKLAFKVLDPAQHSRKIVVSTNIAETSVTIDGIGAVIDCGLSKQAAYDPSKDATVLKVKFIDQSSAKQRAGRAGRTAAGDCYRLYSYEEFEDMAQDRPAELLCCDATAAILSVLRQIQKQTAWISDIRQFPFVEHPGEARLEKALKMLFYLGALESERVSTLTEQGQRMAKMSNTPPRVAAILFEAKRLDVLDVTCVAVAMASAISNLFRRGRDDAEISRIAESRNKFASQFLELGDVGCAISIWLEAFTQKANLRGWSNDNCLNFFSLQDSLKQVRNMISEITSGKPRNRNKQAQTIQRRDADDDEEDDESESLNPDEMLASITSESFADPIKVQTMCRALMAGYFSNLAFLVPSITPSADQPPQYFLPTCNQLGYLPSNSSYRAVQRYPEVACYLEIVENKRFYISGLFGMPLDQLDQSLPQTYLQSGEYARLRELNGRKQMLSNPAIVPCDCMLAFKKFAGVDGNKLKAVEADLRTRVGLPPTSELVIEVDQYQQRVLVMCGDSEKKEAIAAAIGEQLRKTTEALNRRVKEWSIPNSTVRAVCTTGGQCKELILKPTQSINVRFYCQKLSNRLAEPITSVSLIPPGFFTSLALQEEFSYSDAEVTANLAQFSHNLSDTAAERRRRIEDIRHATLGQVMAAMEYTAGAVCFTVNPLLRACNEEKCLQFEPYIRALQSFQRLRSSHRSNRKVDMVVYRGCTLSDEIAATYFPGSNAVWSSFTSTTTNIAVARNFAVGGGAGGMMSVIFEITTSQFCPLADISVYSAEEEVLFGVCSAFTVTSVHMTNENEKYIRMQHHSVPPPHLFENRATAAALATRPVGKGPHIFPIESTTLKQEEGVANQLETEIRRLDNDADVYIQFDATAKRVWGRATFSSLNSATAACELFNGSIIGDRELQAHPNPTPSSICPTKCTVKVTLSQLQMKSVTIDTSSEVLATTILRQSLMIIGVGTKWNILKLFRSATDIRIRQHKTWRSVLQIQIPDTMTIFRVEREMKQMFPALANSTFKPFRDDKENELECKALKQKSVQGSRDRIAFLSALAGPALEMIEETGLDRGAQYLLWFSSHKAAFEAAERIDGQTMAETRLKCSVSINSSTELLIQPDIFKKLEGEIRDEIESLKMLEISVELKSSAKAGSQRSDRKRGDEMRGDGGRGHQTEKHSVSIFGDDNTKIQTAYQRLSQLQHGTMIAVPVNARSKVFPAKSASEAQKERAAAFFSAVEREHHCVVRPMFAQAAIRVTGRIKCKARVLNSLTEFLKMTPFEIRIRVPFKAVEKVRKFVSENYSSREASGTVVDMDRRGALVVSTQDESVINHIKTEVSNIMSSCKLSSGSECGVCYDNCRTKLQTCGHVLCDDCGNQYCSSNIYENRVPLCCTECRVPLMFEDLSRIADDVNVVYMAGVRAYLVAHSDQYSNCHTPDCAQILEKTEDCTALCPVCLMDQCPSCGELPHPQKTCEEAAADLLLRKSTDGQVQQHVSHIINNLSMPFCPNAACGISFDGFSNCFAVTCTRCSTGFCGYCLKNCGKDAHAHAAACPFVQKHFKHTGWSANEAMFLKCMRIRLAEMAVEYIRTIANPDTRRGCVGAVKSKMTSTFFDINFFTAACQEAFGM